jgi:hypothetical protein
MPGSVGATVWKWINDSSQLPELISEYTLDYKIPALKYLERQGVSWLNLQVTAAASSIDPSTPGGPALRHVLMDPALGSAVAGHFLGKLDTRVDAEFRVHMREMGLHRPPGNE